jgi:hypothetical protein
MRRKGILIGVPMRFAHVGHPISPPAPRSFRAPIDDKVSPIQCTAQLHENFAQIVTKSLRLHIVASGPEKYGGRSDLKSLACARQQEQSSGRRTVVRTANTLQPK